MIGPLDSPRELSNSLLDRVNSFQLCVVSFGSVLIREFDVVDLVIDGHSHLVKDLVTEVTRNWF
jgi:hypothetical protein